MNRAGRSLSWLAMAATLVAVTGCEPDPLPVRVEPTGAVRVAVVVPRSVPSGTVARVAVTVSGEGIPSQSAELTGSGELWQGRVRHVRQGEGRVVRAEGFDAAGQRLFQLEEHGLGIARRREPLVVLTAPDTATASPDNAAPFVDALVASSAEVAPGRTLALRTRVHDTDPGEVLTFAWRATGGTFDAPANAAATWTAPAFEGEQRLTLVVSDARGASASLDFTVLVRAGDEGSPSVWASYNRWPRTGPLSVPPSVVVAIGESVTVEASGTDGDGDALSYAWSASCEGTWTDAGAQRASFSPSAVPAGACNNCQLTVTLEDGHGGRATSSVGVCVRPPRAPPSIVSTSRSAASVGPGEVLRLGVVGSDPNDEPFSIAWSANAGVLAPPVHGAGASEVEWVVPSCIPPDAPPRITVTLTNASGLSVAHDFPVEWSGRTCTRPACAMGFRSDEQRLSLDADCTSDGALFIPEGVTFDGAGRELRVVDAPGAAFSGAVVRNRGTTMHVRNLIISGEALAGECRAGQGALRGVLFEGASGSITDSEVRGMRKGGDKAGCQEGHGIEVRNVGPGVDTRKVEVLRNQVSGYQKTGILAVGRVDVTVADNVVEGGGPTGVIARNGIQFDDGATGRVTGNRVDGNAYTGGGTVSTGLLVVGGSYDGRQALCTDLVIEGNTLEGNDVGIYLSQAEGPQGKPPATSTRIRVTDNTLTRESVTNPLYQAAIADLGGGNTLFGNRISGAGYAPSTVPGRTFDVSVEAGAAAKVAFLTGPHTVGAGACSGRLVVQSQDALGNLKALAGPFSLEATGEAAPGVTFHADGACAGEALTTVSLDNPQAQATFYFKAPQAGALTVGVAGAGLSGAQTQTVR